jgi:hypothetical protein
MNCIFPCDIIEEYVPLNNIRDAKFSNVYTFMCVYVYVFFLTMHVLIVENVYDTCYDRARASFTSSSNDISDDRWAS